MSFVPTGRGNVSERDQQEVRTNLGIPVVFYSRLMAVAFGMEANKDAALDHHMIKPLKLVELAKKGGA
jgi:heterodisulfide reductase subunit B